MNTLYLLAGFGACSLMLACYCFVKWQIQRITKDRIRRAIRTPDLPTQAHRSVGRYTMPPNYAVKPQTDTP